MGRKLALTFLGVICLLPVLATVIAFTGIGLQAVLFLAPRFVGGELTIERGEGSLVGGFTLEGIRYMDSRADVSVDHLGLQWSPSSLLRQELRIHSFTTDGVSVRSMGAQDEPVNVEEPGALAAIPILLVIESASVSSLSILSGDQETIELDAIRLQNLRLEGFGGEFASFELRSARYATQLKGTVNLDLPVSFDVTGSFTLQPKGYGVITGEAGLSGNMEKAAVSVQLAKPFTGTLQGILQDIGGDTTWVAELDAREAHLPSIAADWPIIDFRDFTASGSGTLTTYAANIETIASYDRFKDLLVITNLEGDGDGLRLTDTSFSGADYSLAGHASLDWRETFSWQADVQGQDINPNRIDPTWPVLDIQTIMISGTGVLSTYELAVSGGSRSNKLDQATFQAAIKGDEAGLRASDLRFATPAGSAQGSFTVGWTPDYSWEGELRANAIDPSLVDERFPGQLDMSIRTTGRYDAAGISGTLELAGIKGELRGYPLSADAMITAVNGQVTVDRFIAATGPSVVNIQGTAGDNLDLALAVKSTDLASVWPGLGGRLNIDGTVRGKREQPQVAVTLQGSAIAVQNISMESIVGNAVGVFAPDASLKADVSISGMTAGDLLFDSVVLNSTGPIDAHRLKISVEGERMSLSLLAEGELAAATWSGTIQSMDFMEQLVGRWQLTGPAELAVSLVNISTFSGCFRSLSDAGLCLNGDHQPSGSWSGAADISGLPLFSLVQLPASEFGSVTGDLLNGSLRVAGAGSELHAAELDLSLDDLSIHLLFDEELQRPVKWIKNRLHAELSEGVIRVTGESELEDGSSIHANGKVSNLTLPALNTEKINLEIGADFNVRDLSNLNVLTFPFAEPNGTLGGSVAVTGPVSNPSLTGKADLTNGTLIISSLGITLADLDLRLASVQDKVDLRVTCRSGDGTLTLDGSLLKNGGYPDRLKLVASGDRFELVNLPEWHLIIASDLRAELTRERGNLTGSVAIQEGLIAPRSIAGSVRSSRDVVIVHDKDQERKARWPFTARLDVSVKDRLKVNAFGLKGSLEGQLHIEDHPDRTAMANGNLGIKAGKFNVYGRELDIRAGRLLFSGGPVDNPGISVRAENVTQGIKTGVAVSGFLQEPEITFYSDPPMSDNEIIARLLMNTSLTSAEDDNEGLIASVADGTGLQSLSRTVRDVQKTLRVDDIKVESGKTSEDLSLVIGTWLTPSLYVSYGKNLLKESGSFNTKYMLGLGFFVETETGTTASGADLKFEIER